jgi:hypothetical protein
VTAGRRKYRGLRIAGVLLLALCLAVGLAAGDAAAKKKKKKASVFAASISPNQALPERASGSGHQDVMLTSAITVPKKFKGKTVGDVNVTGIRTTGDGPTSADGVNLMLVSPAGTAVLLDAGGLDGQNIGPLTLDDDTPTEICDDNAPTCSDPDATLIQPFAGTANLTDLFSGDTGPLVAFNGSPMRGVWTMYAWDSNNSGNSGNVFNSWGLHIKAAKPVKR